MAGAQCILSISEICQGRYMTYILNGWPLLWMGDVDLMEARWLSAGLSSAKLSEHLLAQP